MCEKHCHCKKEHQHEEKTCGCDTGCGCAHEHGGSNNLILWQIGTALIAFIIAISGVLSPVFIIIVYLISFLVAGYDVVYKAIYNLIHGNLLDENSLMTIATAGAIAIGEYPEAAMVMILYQTGEFLQHKAVEKSKRSIAELMDIRPDYANIEQNSKLLKVSPETVRIGDIIVVQPGEKIPLDGKIIFGEAAVDTSALTGESRSRHLKVDDEAISGFINISGLLKIRVEKSFGESTVSQILKLVEHADSRKARAEKFITRFAHYYTPAVVAAAFLLAIVPSLLFTQPFAIWLERALTFLVISCPCALVISVPLSFFAGIGGASKKGILIKGSNYLETLARTKIVVFDKTGTLTEGRFSVAEIVPANGIETQQLLQTAALAESASNHPIAISIKQAAGSQYLSAQEIKEIAGMGIVAKSDNDEIIVGSARLMVQFQIAFSPAKNRGTLVYVAKNSQYLGYIHIADKIKPDAKAAISQLTNSGIKTVMLSGDTQEAAQNVANELGINCFFAGLMPGQKVEQIESIMQKNDAKGAIAFVGDGINDAPVLTRADIGIAMGGLGSDAAIEAADAVIMDDNPLKIALAIELAAKTMRIVRQNIGLALGIKTLFLTLGALGLMTMWGAVFADVGVSILAVLNALRALKA